MDVEIVHDCRPCYEATRHVLAQVLFKGFDHGEGDFAEHVTVVFLVGIEFEIFFF